MDTKKMRELAYDIDRISTYWIEHHPTGPNGHGRLWIVLGNNGMVKNEDAWLTQELDRLMANAKVQIEKELKKIVQARTKMLQKEIQKLAMSPELAQAIETMKAAT